MRKNDWATVKDKSDRLPRSLQRTYIMSGRLKEVYIFQRHQKNMAQETNFIPCNEIQQQYLKSQRIRKPILLESVATNSPGPLSKHLI